MGMAVSDDSILQVPAAFAAEAMRLLRSMLGPDAHFRDGQLEAIHALVEGRSRLLVVQKTGWGKSLVYFIATRMLRDRGGGPTFLVSPLLSLMRDQERMASSIGVRATRLTSDNRESWADVTRALQEGRCDLLMVSPERLANEHFRRETLPMIEQGIGMLVIDEAHCISDWGHDFRPDYRRIVQVVQRMPVSVPILATTATANNRVVADIESQLGQEVEVIRGALTRPSLRLQAIDLPSQTERLAWLATHLPSLPGSGIIYCLTVRDTDLVARWLQSCGIDVAAYSADLLSEQRIDLEERLRANDLKALVATVALGMGFDKPDLGFVIHYQRPGSTVAYYQQIGRAGRSVDDAYAILLSGAEDDEILDYFIESAFPKAEHLTRVVEALGQSDGMTLTEIEQHVNLRHRRLEQALKVLEVDGAVVREGRSYQRTARSWKPDTERAAQVTALRNRERARMQEFVETDQCLMEFVAHDLDDPTAVPCGRCANCSGDIVPRSWDPELATRAAQFVGRAWMTIRPRKMLPTGILPERSRKIEPDVLNQNGLSLCSYTDRGLGDLVKSGKYGTGRFDDRLVRAAAEAISASWAIDETWWVTAIPSRRHPELVADFAARLADQLGFLFAPVLTKIQETAEQKLMDNSYQQLNNILHAFRVSGVVSAGPVILVDDMVDSGWTLTLCGAHLRRAGSGEVYPFALASLRGA